jgi:hypothetical protein
MAMSMRSSVNVFSRPDSSNIARVGFRGQAEQPVLGIHKGAENACPFSGACKVTLTDKIVGTEASRRADLNNEQSRARASRVRVRQYLHGSCMSDMTCLVMRERERERERERQQQCPYLGSAAHLRRYSPSEMHESADLLRPL